MDQCTQATCGRIYCRLYVTANSIFDRSLEVVDDDLGFAFYRAVFLWEAGISSFLVAASESHSSCIIKLTKFTLRVSLRRSALNGEPFLKTSVRYRF